MQTKLKKHGRKRPKSAKKPLSRARRRHPRATDPRKLAHARRLVEVEGLTIKEAAKITEIGYQTLIRWSNKLEWNVIAHAPHSDEQVTAEQVNGHIFPRPVGNQDLLGPNEVEGERARLRMMVRAIRAVMTVEQLQQLKRWEEAYFKYLHYLEVYLDPERYVETSGLTPEATAEAVLDMRRQAFRILVPTEKDNLANVFGIINASLKNSIELKRTVAGLNKLRMIGAAMAELDEYDDPKNEKPLVDVDSLPIEQLRLIHQAMETLDAHHRAHREAPKPPVPDSIDDLLGAEPLIVKDPDEIAR